MEFSLGGALMSERPITIPPLTPKSLLFEALHHDYRILASMDAL
jgi:hypothetical protein